MGFNELMRFVFSSFWIWLGFTLLLSIVCNSVVNMWSATMSVFGAPQYINVDDNEDEEVKDDK